MNPAIVRLKHLCPADDLSIGSVLWALEHLDAGDGLHGFTINGTGDSVVQRGTHLSSENYEEHEYNAGYSALGSIWEWDFSGWIPTSLLTLSPDPSKTKLAWISRSQSQFMPGEYLRVHGLRLNIQTKVLMLQHTETILHPLLKRGSWSSHWMYTHSWLSDWSSFPQLMVKSFISRKERRSSTMLSIVIWTISPSVWRGLEM